MQVANGQPEVIATMQAEALLECQKLLPALFSILEIQMNILGAVIDNLSDADPDEIKDQLTTMFVRLASTIHRCDDDFTHEQMEKLAALLCEFYPDDEHLSGREAETLFHDTYQKVWKAEMGTTEDTEDWNGDIDWRKFYLPKKIIVRLTSACAHQDSVNTKAWYKYVQEHADELKG